MNVSIRVVGQSLLPNSNIIRIASGSKNSVKFIFSFTDDWESLTKSVQFIQGDSSFIVEIENDNTCYLPELITDGDFTLSLYGVGGDSDNVIATTNTLTFNNVRSIWMSSQV